MYLLMLRPQSWWIDRIGQQWSGGSFVHTALLLLALVLLEAVLSADNAVALASLVQHIEPVDERQRVLNAGLVIALLLRILAVAGAGFVVHQPVLRALGGAYLIWLALVHFQAELRATDMTQAGSMFRPRRGVVMILLVGVTDLAFSLDSVSAAVGVTDRFWLVVLAGIIGLLLLRCMAGWMLVWMERFPNLQNAGYLTVLAVGLRLVGQVFLPALVPSEPILLLMVMVLLGWGFIQPQVSDP